MKRQKSAVMLRKMDPAQKDDPGCYKVFSFCGADQPETAGSVSAG
jgi:hypothetical protein